jgi:hypothetical protein
MDADPAKAAVAQQHDAIETSSASAMTESIKENRESVASPMSPLESDSTTSAGHDSMVTVRLSEPPPLSVNTDLPPSTLSLRKSISGPAYTPTGTVAATIQETEPISEEDVQQPDSETDSEAAGSSNDAEEAASDNAANNGESNDIVSNQLSDEDAEDSETEEVNWDKLQQTEDEEAQDGDDKVSQVLFRTVTLKGCIGHGGVASGACQIRSIGHRVASD